MNTNLATKSGNINPIAENITTGNAAEATNAISAREKIINSNLAAIEKFFSWYGKETQPEFSKFLLDILCELIEKDEDLHYTHEYKDTFCLHMRMLNDFVQSLRQPLKEVS